MEDRDRWKTPQELWDKLHKQYNFNFDCCADHITTKCENWSEQFEKSIGYFYDDVCWMNPPFSKAYQMFEHFFKEVSTGVAIYRCDNMETQVWQDIILEKADWIAIPKGRITYEGFEGNGSRFPSALIGLNVEVPKLEGWKILKVDKKGLKE